MAIRLVIFDMDGVVFEGRNFWLDLHTRLGTQTEALALADRYLRADYHRLSEITVRELWKGCSAAPMFRLVSERRYQAGVFEVFSSLRARNIRSALVTSGPLLLAQRAQRDLKIDLVRANHVFIEDERFVGRVDVQVSDPDKATVGCAVMQYFDVEAHDTAMVGDSESDAPLARKVGLPIAYDSDSEILDEACSHHLPHGELRRLTGLIDVSSS